VRQPPVTTGVGERDHDLAPLLGRVPMPLAEQVVERRGQRRTADGRELFGQFSPG
jgi:hypothetical protein